MIQEKDTPAQMGADSNENPAQMRSDSGEAIPLHQIPQKRIPQVEFNVPPEEQCDFDILY